MSVFSKYEIDEKANNLFKFLRTCSSSKNFLFQEKEKILLKTSFQGIFNLKFDNEVEKLIHQILMETCIKAEKISPGGFDATLEKILDQSISHKNLESYHPCLDDIHSILDKIFEKNLELKLAVHEAIMIAGFGGRISVEKSANNLISVEEINGFFFKVKKTFETKSIKIKHPKLVCIDGYIESVSELNRLFEEASETKTPIILIARGFHDDVLNTIKINRVRGSMNIYAVLIEFDIYGINKINDIAIVSNHTPISSNLGQLISNICIDDCSKIDEIILDKNSILIKNSNISDNISRHISFLLQQRDEKNGVEEIIDERLKSMSSKNVIIRIPDSTDFAVINQKIDYTLRSIRCILDLGITDNNQLFSSHIISEKFSENFESLLNNLGTIIL